MANGTLLDELMAQMKKNKQAPSVGSLSPSAPKTSNYETMFKKALDETYRYAQVSPQTARDVANTISPGGAMTAYARGDVQSFDWDEAIQAERDRASATDYFRKSGLYDNDDYLYNDAYRFLVGDDYLKKQQRILPMGLAASSASDAIEDVRRSLVKNDPRAEWRNFYDLYGYETEQQLEIMLRAEAIAKGTNRTVRDFDLMDDETFDREYEALETWYKGLDPVTLTERYDSQTDDYLSKIKTVDKEISRRSEIDEFRAGIRSNEDYGTMSAFTGPGLPEGAWSQTRTVTQEDIDALNDPYSFINSGATWEQLTNSREKLAYVAEYMDAGYNMLTPDEIADYNYLINTGREDDAAYYLELLRPELLLRRAMVAKSWQTVKATNPALAVPTWLEAGIQNLANIAYLPYQFYEAATGRDDPFSPAFDALNKNKWTSEAQLGWIEDSGMADWLKDVTSVVYKGASGWRDNVIRLAASGFNPTVSLIIAGAQSASGSLHESSERDDVSGAAKIVKALATGAIEMGTEKIGLDALFSKGHGGALEYLKGVILSELGEESLNYISEPALEAAVAFLFDHEAEIMSDPEFWNGLTDTMLTTAISSLLMGGGGAIQMDAGHRRAGKGLRNDGDVESVLQIAEGLGADTTSAQIAKAIRAAEEGGKKVSTRELGKLVSALSSDIGEQNAAAVNAVYEDAIADRLIELGEEKSKARKQAKVIRRISAGEVLSAAERMSVNWSDNASQVVRELTTETREGDEGRVGRDWKVRAVQLAEETSAPYVDKGVLFAKALHTKPGTTTETTADPAVSSDEVVKQGEEMAAAGKNKFGPNPLTRAVIFDADGTEQTGEVVRFEKDKDGMHAVVATTADGKTSNVNVDLESITASASAGIGSIVRYIQNSATRGHDMSAAEASTMIRLYEQEGGEAKAFIDGFEKAYLAGYAGIELDSAGISEEVAKIAYDQGKAEAVADEKGRVARATRVRADSKGVVSWLGKVSSGKEVRGAGDPNALSAAMRKMTSSQRTTVQVVQAFADKFKTNVVLFESSEENIGSIENGSYDPNTNTIYIDINSGADSAESIKAGRKHNTLGHAMVRTLGHELTHHLESTSPEAYATYKQAVKTALKEQGQDWATLVRGKLDTARNAGRKLTYAGAEAEVIADASEYMLQNSKFVKEIDNSTKGRVKKFIKDFMKKLGEVFSTLTRAHTESAAIRKEIDGVKQYMGNLQQLWDAAMEETLEKPEVVAGSGEAEEMVKELQPVTQFQGRTSVEKREDGLMAMHNLNSRKLLDALRLGGFPMPSIAIVKAKQGHTMYGDYSVIFGADTIDPKSNEDNRVYGNDAWTPIFPPVETELDSDRVLALRRDTKSLVDNVDGYLGQMVSRFYNNFVGESVTNETEDSTIEKAWRNEGMLAAYLLENGSEVQVLQHQVPVDRGYKPEYAEIYDAILDVIGDADTTGMSVGKMLEVYGEQLAAANDVLNRMWQRYNAGDRRSGIAIINRIGQAKRYNEAGRDLNPLMKTENDYDATAEAMRNQINQDSFDRWVLSKLNKIFKRKGIYNGKERFTSSGDRKSWKATHYDYTVDNVVQAMLQQEESDIPATNASGLKAAASTMYTNLDEIRADSYRLGKVNEEEFNARMAKADNDFRDFLNAIQAWDYDVQEEAGNLLVSAAKKRYKAQEIVDLFKANGFKRVTLNAAKIAESVIRQVQNIPTGYFEAKPARVVSFDEVRMVVAPDNIPAELVQALEERGIPYTTYDGTDEDRLEKANAVENVQFSSRAQDQLDKSATDNVGTFDPNNPDIRYSTRDQTDTESFKRWFGNSKVVNWDGTPKVMYHGSSERFTVFDKSVLNDKLGFFFTEDKREAQDYGTPRAFYLKIENPYDIWDGLDRFGKTIEEKVQGLKNAGYDGIESYSHGTTWYIAFEPTQIKSATDNVGTFDPNNPDIRYSTRDAEYMQAVESGNMETAQRMVDEAAEEKMPESKLRTKDGKLRKVYHGTNAGEFYEFNPDYIGSSSGDDGFFGMGFYFAYSKGEASYYGAKRIISAYLDLKNPFDFEKEIRTLHGKRARGGYAPDAVALVNFANKFPEIAKKISITVAKGYGSDVERISAAEFARKFEDVLAKQSFEYQEMQDQWGNPETLVLADPEYHEYEHKGEIRKYKDYKFQKRFAGKPEELDVAYEYLSNAVYSYIDMPSFTRIILDNNRAFTNELKRRGYDGTIQSEDGDEAVAFSPEQIKYAEPVTYDDYGDVVPLSERFNTESPDIRYSTRDLPPEVTAREFLTEADSSIAETVEERNAMSIYQGLLLKHADASDKVIAAERVLAVADEADLPEARKALTAARARQKELYNRLLNVERTAHVQTIVKRTNRIIGELSGKNKADLDNMVSTLQTRLESMRLDLQGLKGAAKTQREADIRAVEREMANLQSKAVNALLATNEKYTKRVADLRERNELNVEIGKKTRHIKRVVKRLNDRIIHEEDYKNVKEPLKPAVHNLVRAFIDGFGNLVFDQKTADRLRTVYDKIADEKEGSPDFYSDDVANWLTDLAALAEEDEARRIAGGSSIESVEQKMETYNRVAEIADHIYKMVAEADEIFVNGKRESFAAISGEVGGGLVSKKDKPLLVGKAREAVRIFDDLIRTGNMTPQYFFDHLKNSGLSKLFSGLMTGQTQYAQRIREGQETIADAKRRYNFYAWKNMKQGVEFKTEQGHTISLTVPQMMWVYATAKREATNTLMDTHHLDEGGFQYEANDLPKQKGKLTAIPGIDRLHKLSANDVAKITATLTAEQIACADELVSYLSNECAEQGNAASMELFGIKKYNEEYYFPFKTASDQRYQRSDAGSTSATNDARVKHASFTHSLRKGANTALVMGDFFDVIADHINLMATYSSFVVPIESMNRVLNTKINEEKDGSGNDVTIRSLVGRKHGDPAQKYIADLMKDLNGGPQTDNRGGISGLFRAFKRGAVMGSLSVALQQPTAIVRAFAYVNPKYFAHITMEGNKKTWERMMKYSGTTVIKDMGKFDVGTGRMANDWIANSDTQDYKLWQRAKFLMDTKGWKAVKDNFIETMTALPGVMDRITWSHIWKAIEAEQADLNPSMDRNSDEFLRTVGARFDDVINHTQVYDSILAKSQNMRSKNPLTQMSTAFMSEPTLNINMLYDVVRGDHSKGQRASIITSVITSNILAAAAAALIASWNKDDDDRNAVEKYLTTFASRALDNLNPLTMVPYVADLWNLVNGYDIERTDLSVIKDAWDYGSTFMSKAFDPEKENTWRDYENFFGTIANLFGIPAKNVSRDIRRARNFLATDKAPAPGSNLKYALVEELTPFGLYKSSNSAYCQRLVAAVVDGDAQEAYDLWDYMTNGKKMSQGSLETNIRSELKRLVKAGEITPAQATSILRKYVPYKDDKNNVKYPQDWLNEKE